MKKQYIKPAIKVEELLKSDILLESAEQPVLNSETSIGRDLLYYIFFD